MKPTSKILKQLKCCECDCYLSRSPIFLNEDGSAICGRCPKPEKPAIRMVPYEKLIEMLSFPCMYQTDGCPNVVPFEELKDHEEACEYRSFICPVVPSGKCEWIGTVSKLLEHCESEHNDKVLQHPCVLQNDILQSSIKSYITKVFNILFIIHVKVCLSSRKIFHSVHYMNKDKTINDLTFKLDIQRNEVKISKNGTVSPLGCMTIKENLSVPCSINSLLEILEGFMDTTFTITILGKITEKSEAKPEIQSRNIVEIPKLPRVLTFEASRNLRACKYKENGCRYQDLELRIDQHEELFCKFSSYCRFCMANISEILNDHYKICHSPAIFKSGSRFPISNKDLKNTVSFIIVGGHGERFFFTLFSEKQNKYSIVVNSSLHLNELFNYTISMSYSVLNSDKKIPVPLKKSFDKKVDWFGNVEFKTVPLVQSNKDKSVEWLCHDNWTKDFCSTSNFLVYYWTVEISKKI